MAGPETPFALGQQGIEEAMQSATAGSMGIVGAEQPTASTRGRVDVPAPADPAAQGSTGGMGLDMGIESPQYGWRVTPQDLGQAPVASIGTPTGPVPVAQQMLPFGAIAARQQATAERKAALAEAQKKAAAAFDPFKGISDPADPYQTTFNQYIRDEYTRMRQEMADAYFGGDTAAFDKWVIEKPEGQMWMRMNFTMPMDAIAKENKARVQAVADFLVEAAEMKWDIDPEDYKKLQEYTTLINDIGAPLSGVDSRELLLKGRSAERVMSKVRFQKEFLKGFAEYAQQMPQEISFSRPAGAGGKIVMQVKDERVFNDYIDAMADSAAEARMFGKNKEAAKEWLRKLIKDKYDVKVSTFDPYDGSGKSSASAGTNTPIGTRIDATPVPQPKEGVRGIEEWKRKSMYEAPSMRISTKVGNEWRPIEKVDVTDASGSYRMMLQPRFTWKNGEYVIAGKMLDRTSELAITNALKSEGIDYDPAKSTWDNLTTEQMTTVNRVVNKYTKNEAVPLRYNMDILSSKSGYRSGDEMLSALLAEAGHKVSPQQAGEMISTDKGRLEINRMLGFVKDEVPGQSGAKQGAGKKTIKGF